MEGKVQMISSRLYNNLGIDALAIAFVLEHTDGLPVSKILLVAPIFSHQGLLNHLARKTTQILSFEKYIIENMEFFVNFNDRFYSGLINSVNALQLLSELDFIRLQNGIVCLDQSLPYKQSMGKRAEKIFKAAPNISKLISENQDLTYLNLRIEL